MNKIEAIKAVRECTVRVMGDGDAMYMERPIDLLSAKRIIDKLQEKGVVFDGRPVAVHVPALSMDDIHAYIDSKRNVEKAHNAMWRADQRVRRAKDNVRVAEQNIDHAILNLRDKGVQNAY
jgi:hypothetical protein